MKILFVCSSNVCRSPYAEFIFKRMVDENEVLKNNISSVRSSAVFNKSKTIFGKGKISLLNEEFTEEEINKFKPTFKFSDRQLFEEADIIIGMSKAHKFLTPKKYRHKFNTLSEVAIGKTVAIPDPFLRRTQSDYDEVMDIIKTFLGLYANNLIEEFSSK